MVPPSGLTFCAFMTDDGTMSGDVVNLVPEPEPEHHDWLLHFRARIATDIADGRRSDMVFSDLVSAIDDHIDGAGAAIVTIDDSNLAQVRASSLPPRISGLMHSARRRNWFGTWAAAMSRQTPVTVVDVTESSLYREHRAHLVDQQLVAASAVPLRGTYHRVVGALVAYLPQARLLTDEETDVLELAGELAGLVLRRDSNRQELLDRIRYDPLTGLENRDGLEEILRRALSTVGNDGPGVGLLFLDIDDLTLVNDSLGHTAGDTVISTTANRIRNVLMRSDTVVRFGGDEFIVVLDRIESCADARNVADRLRRIIAEPIEIAGTHLVTTVSAGITIGHASTDPLDLIDEGHAAVVRAKQSGRGSTAEHDRILDTGAGARLSREVEIRTAFADDQFLLHWQPKVNVATREIVGAEALVRWRHPEMGIVSPDEFLRTAERAGLTSELSDWIVRTAVSEAKGLVAAHPNFSLAINLPATEFERLDIVEMITAALAEVELDPRHIILELTESVLAAKSVITQLHALRDAGLRVAIDDFGTGYSSLAYVQQLPVQIVKIDRAFLTGLKSDGSGAPVLAAAIAMAQALGLSTIVEGVEEDPQVEGLETLGADWAQGYLFSEPVPHRALLAMLANVDE